MSKRGGETQNGDAVGKKARAVGGKLVVPDVREGDDPVYNPGGTGAAEFAAYEEEYARSVDDPDAYWGQRGRELISWFRDFDSVKTGRLEDGDTTWFAGGKLNVSYNCIDRHLETRSEQTAILWEGNMSDEIRRISFRELYLEVNRFANLLKELGVRKGETVCIYMPMVPEAAYAMLACARLGAPHSVVFAGFSAEALRDRILDANCRVVLTADEGLRGAKKIPLKATVDKACKECPGVQHVVVLQRTGADVAMVAGRDTTLREALDRQRPYCPPEHLDSEDVLFMLYTSGSTGKPKGIVHSQAGYLLYTMVTTQTSFALSGAPGDVHFCMADLGWITGHSYIVYGPLGFGNTTFMFEGIPTYPECDRYWDMVARHKPTSFYTAPTAIRALMKAGPDPVKKHDRSSLRVLGTVGEPINPEAWKWYHEVVGDSKIPIVDTFWQTESGGHLVTPNPAVHRLKPGAAVAPFFGIELAVLDEKTGEPIAGNDVKGVLAVAQSWPSMTRTIHGDHQRYLTTYFKPYPGYYFTGDGCMRDKDGYIWITGRVDDVLNVSGHRIGTAEVESALVAHEACAEAAVVGIPHDVKGQAIFAYCSLADGFPESADLVSALKQAVRSGVGAFAQPDYIVVTPILPKTRSGKIMRRVLRKIACKESDQLGDTSTMADQSAVPTLIERVGKLNL